MGSEMCIRDSGGRRTVDVYCSRAPAEDVLDEERDRAGMVDVRVGQQNRVDPGLPLDRQGLGQRAGIEGDRVVDQQTRHPATQTLTAVSSDDLDLHDTLSLVRHGEQHIALLSRDVR